MHACMHAESVRELKGLSLPRATAWSHSGEIALAGSRHLLSTLSAASGLFAHAVVTVAIKPYTNHPWKLRSSTQPLRDVCEAFGGDSPRV